MGIMISGIDSLPNISVSKSVYIEFATADYFQKGCIFFSPWAQGTNPLAFPMNWAANRLNDLTQQTIHLDRGEGIQIPLIRSLRNLGSPMQIGNAFTHWLPGTGAFGIPLFWTINLEILGGIYGGLDAKDTSLFVVDFYRVAFEVMLQSDAFAPVSIMADDFTLEIAMGFFPQKNA
jgi:hypothetical protein